MIRFARYTNRGEEIELFDARTHEIDYIAVSHVWNTTDWRALRGFGRRVLLSEQKQQFLEQKLHKIVGNLPFWLDVITIDQTNQTEVISIVRHIPNIFKHAKKTIAVREGDGFFNCCAEVLVNFDDPTQLNNVLARHMEADHEIAPVIEYYLNRFWTLQELLLSHTVEFTTCIDGEKWACVRQQARADCGQNCRSEIQGRLDHRAQMMTPIVATACFSSRSP